MKYKNEFYESKRGSDGLFHFVYKTTNNINGKYYIGVHNTRDLGDGYKGSGKILANAFKKYGKKYFSREIINFFDTSEEAFNFERDIVNQDLINNDNCYNVSVGSTGNSFHGIPLINTNTGEYILLSKDDPLFDPNIHKSVNLGYRRVLDKNTGKSLRILKSEFDPNIHDTIYKNTLTVYNTNTCVYERVTVDEYNSNDNLISPSKNKVTVWDEVNKIYLQVNKNHPKYISGEFQSISKNKWIIRDKTTKQCLSVPKGSEIDWDKYEFASCRLKKSDDPNYILARTIYNNKYKWVLKTDDRFKTFDLIPYIKKGNTIRNVSLVNDTNTLEINLTKDEVECFLKNHNNWKLGRKPVVKKQSKNLTWVNDGNKNKMIKKEDLKSFLLENDGWKPGCLIKKNLYDKKIRVTNGVENKFIYSKDIENFLSKNNDWFLFKK